MHLQILGTGAAEGWPAVFCACRTCRLARAAGGKNIRSRASVLIDGSYKIDVPPDTYYHSVCYGLHFSELRAILFTHSHDDHFAPGELNYLKKPFAHDLANEPIPVYGNNAVLQGIESKMGSENLPIATTQARPYCPIQTGHLTFLPVPAKHKPDEEALNYVVLSGDKTVLYASDTGRYDSAMLERLSEYCFDLLIVECTQGCLATPPTFHMGFDAVLELRDYLENAHSLKSGARTVITHFSHNIAMLHDELQALAAPEEIEVAYDGIELSV